MAPIRNEIDEANENVPKCLCEMTNHLGCVNSVRWSCDGKSLASGGDDALVMIWQIKYQGSSTSFGGTNHEQWGCVNMLRGHSGDILGVAWSHDQKYLASCSVDNTIIIWNAKDLPQKVTLITGHEGLVKGLSWDPVGKYMASQSDDHSVRIWRTNDWKEVKQIREPFKKCGGTTHVLRLSWSPDGKFIVTAHALNNDGPTAQIIERGDWKTGIDFVGHRKAVEVVSFNPHLFVKKDGVDHHGCIALGSRDRSLSVWLTNLKRPLVVLHDLFTDSILDLSWSKDGYELIVCSTDGSVAYLKFTAKELGAKVSEQALDEIFMATYGSQRAAKNRNANTSTILIEDPTMLKLVDQQETVVKGAMTSTPLKKTLNKSLEMVSTTAAIASITKQIETKTSDGRRRITPVTLTTQPSSVSGAPLPFTSFSPKQNKGVIMDPSPPAGGGKKPSPQSNNPSIKSPPPKPMRFEPLSPINEPKQTEVAESSKSGTLKRTLDTVAIPKAKKLKLKRSKVATTVEASKPSTPQKPSSLSSIAKQSQVLLPVPDVEGVLTLVVSNGLQDKDSMVVQINNNASSKNIIKCSKNDAIIWSNGLPTAAVVAGGNSVVTCVVCSDKSVHMYSSQSGRLLLPTFHLFSPPHALKVESSFVLVICSNATATVWDVDSFKATVREASFSHLVQDGKKTLPLESVDLTATGVPAISIKGTTYVYHNDMCVWLEACTRMETSEIHLSDSVVSLDCTLPLRTLQKLSGLTRTDTVGQMLSSLRNPSSVAGSLSYLEAQVSRSYLMQSPLEYSHWSTTYVRYLVREEQELRLREFCGQFTTPSGQEGKGQVLGLTKHSLLRNFLSIIAGNARLQRLYAELRDSLE